MKTVQRMQEEEKEVYDQCVEQDKRLEDYVANSNTLLYYTV